MAPPVLRPDNALKRADELIAVGEKPAALQSLYEFLTARRIRFAQPSAVEPIVFRFLELGVELKKGRLIKDALHQYKRLIQNSPEGLASVSAVSRKYIDYIEAKMSLEQTLANEKQEEAAAADEEDDLEGGVTPDNLLISVYDEQQSVGGFNDEQVTSWLKFTWESYRAVLDLLRNNSQLEITYSGVVSRTMQFCLKYNRKNEFKRLADMLRQHLDAANYQQSRSGHYNIVDLNDKATLQRYLDQRFQQLNVSVKLELWHEAFRSIEDVYHLMKMSKQTSAPLKQSLMANYYENLATIFSISGSHLLHACAFEKFYVLYSKNPNATEDDFRKYASTLFLSALSVPLDDLPTVGYDPQMRLYRLLGVETRPKRKEIIESVLNDSSIFDKVDPEVKKLYDILEVNYDATAISKDLGELLPQLQAKNYFSKYMAPLRDLIIRKLLISASESTEDGNMDFGKLIQMATLPEPMNLSPWEIEKALLQAAVEDYVSFTIDHSSDVISFTKDPFEVIVNEVKAEAEEEDEEEENEDEEDEEKNEIEEEETAVEDADAEDAEAIAGPEPVVTRTSYIRRRLDELSNALEEIESFKNASYLEKVKMARESLITQTNETIENIKQAAEERAKYSQEQKQKYLASYAMNAEQDAEMRQQNIMKERAKMEARMEEENQRRLIEKKKRELAELKAREVAKFIQEINEKGHAYIDPKEAENLDFKDIRKLIVSQLSKDKLELEERMNFSLKKLDYTERALRKTELPLLQKETDALRDKDMGEFEAMKAKIIETAKKEHDEKIEDHKRLSAVFEDYRALKQRLSSASAEKMEARRAENKAKLEAAKQARLDQVRKERYDQLVAERKAELEAKEREEARKKKFSFTRETPAPAPASAPASGRFVFSKSSSGEAPRGPRLETTTKTESSVTPAAAADSEKPLSFAELQRRKREARRNGGQ